MTPTLIIGMRDARQRNNSHHGGSMTQAHIERLMTFAAHGQPKDYAASNMMRADLEVLVMQAIAKSPIAQPVPTDRLTGYMTRNYPDAKGSDLSERVIDTLQTMDIALGMRSIAHSVCARCDDTKVVSEVVSIKDCPDCAAIAQPVQPAAVPGEPYAVAYYEICCLLGLPAMPASPEIAHKTVVIPALKKLLHRCDVTRYCTAWPNCEPPCHLAKAQPVQTAVWHPTEAAITALKRFEETCSDGEGYDVPKDTMRNLAAIGLIYKTHGATYRITDFGRHILEAAIAQPVPPANIPSAEFIRKTNIEYSEWCKTYYQADSLDERCMKSLDGLWAWQEQERRQVSAAHAQLGTETHHSTESTPMTTTPNAAQAGFPMRPLPQWKQGDEFLPYHPQASHINPDHRDGWNACYRAAQAAQPTRKALSDAEIEQIGEEYGHGTFMSNPPEFIWYDGDLTEFTRAIEAKHGIGAQE